jgi:hypothetical protein
MPSIYTEVRRARTTHYCYLCADDIEPGELYERDVHMAYAPGHGRTRFHVSTSHHMMECVIEQDMRERAEAHIEAAVAVAYVIEIRQVVKIARNGDPVIETEPVAVPFYTTTTDESEDFDPNEEIAF